ncbi:MAG: cytochrome c oxidase assembly protein [Chloroflexi bacterium]|nr:MAG: cytochrome c oxidase assembly protein [Chloroflexota bacterium]
MCRAPGSRLWYHICMLRELLTTWELNLPVLLTVAVMATLYLRGWLHLREVAQARERPVVVGPDRAPRPFPLASPWRLAAYLLAIFLLLFALLSGLDAFASLLFFIHMIQHLLILMIVPPLLWLAEPFPISIWGLPSGLRLRMHGLFAGASPFRQLLTGLTRPGLAWLFLVGVTWIWHDGQIYNLTLENELIHDFEHLTFFVVGMVFWWHVIGAGPHLHRRFSLLKRTGYVVAAVPPNMLLGVAIAFASKPIYTYYTTVPRVMGISVMQDQMAGGLIMWIPGSMMYLLAALILITQYLRQEERKAPMPEHHWSGNDELLAPGFSAQASTSREHP